MLSLAKYFWIIVHQNFLQLKFLLYALPLIFVVLVMHYKITTLTASCDPRTHSQCTS